MIGKLFSIFLWIMGILIIGLLAEKWMDKKGKGKNVKNINYYLKRGNSLPAAILKAVAAGYIWLFKVQLKILGIALLAFLLPETEILPRKKRRKRKKKY